MQQYADMLLQVNKVAAALTAYEADLKKHPNRFNSLYGAAFCSKKTGDEIKAAGYYQQLIAISNSNSDRPELALAKKNLQEATGKGIVSAHK
ncbi:tetratricopeptide repeat protein [Ferruginibacter sp.]